MTIQPTKESKIAERLRIWLQYNYLHVLIPPILNCKNEIQFGFKTVKERVDKGS